MRIKGREKSSSCHMERRWLNRFSFPFHEIQRDTLWTIGMVVKRFTRCLKTSLSRHFCLKDFIDVWTETWHFLIIWSLSFYQTVVKRHIEIFLFLIALPNDIRHDLSQFSNVNRQRVNHTLDRIWKNISFIEFLHDFITSPERKVFLSFWGIISFASSHLLLTTDITQKESDKIPCVDIESHVTCVMLSYLPIESTFFSFLFSTDDISSPSSQRLHTLLADIIMILEHS